jgi:hypothetical protein
MTRRIFGRPDENRTRVTWVETRRSAIELQAEVEIGGPGRSRTGVSNQAPGASTRVGGVLFSVSARAPPPSLRPYSGLFLGNPLPDASGRPADY